MEYDRKTFRSTKINAVRELIDNETKQFRATKKDNPNELSISVGSNAVFSHQFLEDLEKLWAIREWIPDPTKSILLSKNKRVPFCNEPRKLDKKLSGFYYEEKTHD